MAKTSRKASRKANGGARMDPRERVRLLHALERDCCALLAGQAFKHDVSSLAAKLKRDGDRLRRGGVSEATIARVIHRAEQGLGPSLKKLTGVDVRRQQQLVENPSSIPLTRGKSALVSQQDHAQLSKHSWYCGHRGYAMRSKLMPDGARKTVSMHREILKASLGQEVDHINRNRLDNRRENLRIIGHGDNLHNRRAMGKTKIAGVSWDARKGCWRAEISKDGQRHWLGYHATKEAAERAFQEASKRLYKSKARQ